jgi:hypothetical protein
LRELVDQMDLVIQHEEFDPMTEYGFTPKDLSATEEHLLSGISATKNDDGLVPDEDTW